MNKKLQKEIELENATNRLEELINYRSELIGLQKELHYKDLIDELSYLIINANDEIVMLQEQIKDNNTDSYFNFEL